MSEELTGGSVNYYRVTITEPTSDDIKPYVAECNDIIEVLEMTPAMANIFKAIWRMAASIKGKKKKGLTLVYDAEKTKFFAHRLYIWACNLEKKGDLTSTKEVAIVSSPEQQKSGCSYPNCGCSSRNFCDGIVGK